MRPIVATALFAAALAFCSPLAAQEGDLDPTWGGDGISAGFLSSVPRASGVAPDQQIYLTGNTTLPDDSEFEWWRLDEGGVGQWNGCSHSLPLLDNFDIREVLFDDADRLLYAGTMTAFGTETVERAFVARFETFDGGASCTLDTNFSAAGWEYFDDAPYCDTEDCRLIDIEATNDATTSYIVLLESVQNALVSQYFLIGLTWSGNIDSNFHGGAFLPVTAPESAVLGAAAAELVVDRANRPYVLYSYYDADGNFDLDVALNRYLQTGEPDGTFATFGRLIIDDENSEDTTARAFAIGSDGRLGLGLSSSVLYSRLRVFEPSLASWVEDLRDGKKVAALAFDGLGRLLATSDVISGDGLEIVRWNADFDAGTLIEDDDFALGGYRFVDIDAGGGSAEAPVDIEFPGGKPLVLVEADQNPSGKQAFFVRLRYSLIFADGFEWGSTKFW